MTTQITLEFLLHLHDVLCSFCWVVFFPVWVVVAVVRYKSRRHSLEFLRGYAQGLSLDMRCRYRFDISQSQKLFNNSCETQVETVPKAWKMPRRYHKFFFLFHKCKWGISKEKTCKIHRLEVTYTISVMLVRKNFCMRQKNASVGPI